MEPTPTGSGTEPRSTARTVFGVAFDGQTWSNLLYMLIALPLGIAYFVVLGAVITVGGGLFAVIVGAAVLVVAMFAWPAVAEMERRLANDMLGTRIEPLPFKVPDGPGLWPQISARLTSVSTWQSLVFLFARLPIGIFAFVAALTGLVLAPITATMSLHVVNGAANLVSRVTDALLQPWDTGTAPAAASIAAEPVAAPSTPPPLAGEQVEADAHGESSEPFSERAGRAAATFTDRVQAVTDEISERARAAARAWNNPVAAAPAPPAQATSVQEQPGDETDDEEPAGEPLDPGEQAARVNVDIVMRTVTVNDEPVELTPREFDLLTLFVQNPARPFSRDELLDRIWRNEYDVTDRTIDTHIQRLRKKLGSAAEVIQTVWGVGYKYQPPTE